MGESLRNSLVVAPIVGLIIGWGVGYVVLPFVRPLAAHDSMYFTHPNPEFAWAITVGTSSCVTSLFIAGAMAPLLHWCTRLVIAATTPLPLSLVPWLDDWVRRDMLTRVGGGWAFRHETLRAWLAVPSPRRPVP